MLSAGAAEHSLVGGSKSSTEILEAINSHLQVIANEEIENREIEEPIPDFDPEAGKYLAMKCEAWRDIKKTDEGAFYTPLDFTNAHFNAVAWTETSSLQAPPAQSGDRWTKALTPGAAKKIEHSAKYLSKLSQGYKAFITLTFTEEQRAEIKLHDTIGAFQIDPRAQGAVIPKELRKTIGNRVTEFLNNLQMAHKRGIKIKAGEYIKKDGTTIPYQAGHIQAKNKKFAYTWVIENPGDNNPHIHILTNWTVRKKLFLGWANWIENKVWGQGFAKIEKIRKPQSAAYYMAKAAGYLAKGKDGEQGAIRGNRYNISKDARAPRAKLIGTYAAQFIRDAIKYGYELGRAGWPKGIHFHQHGFGATSREKWIDLWAAIKKDGFKLNEVTSLMRERVRKAMARYGNQKDYLCGMDLERYADSILEQPETNLSFNEFQQYWGAVA